jgi:hypothetical protein
MHVVVVIMTTLVNIAGSLQCREGYTVGTAMKNVNSNECLKLTDPMCLSIRGNIIKFFTKGKSGQNCNF